MNSTSSAFSVSVLLTRFSMTDFRRKNIWLISEFVFWNVFLTTSCYSRLRYGAAIVVVNAVNFLV